MRGSLIPSSVSTVLNVVSKLLRSILLCNHAWQSLVQFCLFNIHNSLTSPIKLTDHNQKIKRQHDEYLNKGHI